MKIAFRNIRLSKDNLRRLDMINDIIVSYQDQGYRLTLRQLYYQLVSHDVIPNNVKEYGKLSTLLKEGRMAGVVDWDAIEDRLRKPDVPSSWKSPEDMINSCIRQYRVDRMEDQPVYIEVWVEKDALSGVLNRVTRSYGIPIIVNRGYSSVTAMYDAHVRFSSANAWPTILYIGDFDPSGQDMIRDIRERIEEFRGDYVFELHALALTQNQIREYNPPPNPAKVTDPRAKDYIRKFGPVSWEVDALRPEVLHNILDDAIRALIDKEKYQACMAKEQAGKDDLRDAKFFLEDRREE